MIVTLTSLRNYRAGDALFVCPHTADDINHGLHICMMSAVVIVASPASLALMQVDI